MWQRGFTLAELLIALAILGVIATFTIPKILQAQGDQKSAAIAKEVAGMISEAYQAYKAKNTVNPSTDGWAELTPYMNYVKVDTNSLIDEFYNSTGNSPCSSGEPCLKLHNGAMIRFDANGIFGGTNTVHGMWVEVDPDGTLTSPSNAIGPGKKLEFWLYYNGRLTTRGEVVPGTCNNGGSCVFNPNASLDPPWFKW